MSLANDDGSSAMEASESIQESEKKPRISYTRDFLLSLSELEICKSLPSGFDQSVLSEFEDNSVQERPRSHGNLPLQGFRRNDYSSSPPTRGDSSTFSRGVYGRWDNRASGWSDKDGDSQSDLDPDSGRRNHGNNQSRRPWQNSEHDGLLGSGSFPRPSGFAPGTSAPKSQSNDHYHLNRSNEAYQPPRPFKAIPHARTNTHDSFNDETFGSSDIASQDRAEEERKRRASFELMRKEQQKVLQEKQKSSGNKLKSDAFSELLEESKEEGVLEASGGELNSVVQSVPNEDSGKLSSVLQSSKPRPLVPPGFRSTILEKSSTTKTISSMEKEQNPKPGIEEIHLIGKGNHTQNGTLALDNIQSLHKLDITEQGEPNEKLGVGDHHSHRISGFPQLHEAVDGEVFQLNKILSNSSQEPSTSILGKFFGSSTSPAVKDGGPTGFLEQQKTKPDDPLSPRNVQSSRFAQWFNEEEKKPVDDHLSSTRPNDLLSLIVGGDKSASQVPNIISPDPPIAPFGVITKTPSDSNQLYNNYRHESAAPPVVAPVLTCEDLEQTILSEYTEKTSSALPPPVPDWAVSGQDNSNAIPVDNQATNHLLSLLQKGTSTTTIDDDMKSSENQNHPPSEKPKDEGNPGQNLSLESLFGTAFMKELQSAQAPVSAQRGMGSARIDIFEPNELSMNGPLSSSVEGMGNYESNPTPLSSKQKQPVKSDDPESWLKFNGPRVDPDPLEFRIPKAKIGEIELPEEESLISVGDPNVTRDPFGISEKLAALNSGYLRGPHDMFEQESRQFNNNNLHVHGQGPSPQMHAAAQMNQNNNNRRPMFHPLDINSQMRFPEHLMQRGTPPPPALNQQFQPPFHHHPDTRVTGFDVNPGHHQHQQMLPPQMRMQQGNFPPPHLMRDVPRPFMGDREAAAIAAMHGFPFGQQSNIGGLGMPLPGVGDGSHPEVFQRMMEMELRAQSKQQIRPLPLNNNQGGGQGLDMGGFRYR
ncbi:uncharacterized protein LOC111878521 isoform X1 [Lactuca sativa]|uniref:Uncharacterized protein n=1 Tax=Lactuca sativa TaxID=4236 RepID=A0A9R1VSS1_LACSA|nr:uncharacterized protein LOC111878521 isoform X1 [Lactuca sativa]KAJ0210210.1 hypothetical protein LSAT_V11C400170850 [Lactuca sativa]